MTSEQLIEEATKRGYIPGAKIRTLVGDTSGIVTGFPYQHPSHKNYICVQAQASFDETITLNFIIHDTNPPEKWATILVSKEKMQENEVK